MHISKVSNRATIAEFHGIHVQLAEKNKSWIPHLKQDIEKVFNPKKNKLFTKGSAERWIVQKDGTTVGRIAAFINPKTKNSFKQMTGGIGFFDCIEDQEAANLLFNTAKDWLEKQGIEAMDGPINFGEKNQYWGLLIENFENENTYGMNYNPPYYRQLFEEYGFHIYYNQICSFRDIYMPMQQVFLDKTERISKDPSFKIVTAEGKSIDQLADYFVKVYNDAWSAHEGLKGMKKSAALKIFKALKPVMDRKVVIFVFKDDEPIAFFLNVPDLNHYFKRFNGNFHLINKLRFLMMQKFGRPEKLIGIIFGVVKSYQGKGIEGAMIKWSQELLFDTNYKDIVMTWVGDFNPRMLKVIENLGGVLYQKHATYRYLFDRSLPFERAPIIGKKERKKSE
ncbi:MAG: hypothetical protein AAF487_07570 [Bacteroidota bacterium]